MIVMWLDDALSDLKALRRYIARDNPVASKKVVKKILHAIDILSEQPEIGRMGRVPGTRELVVSGVPYIVPYRIKNNVIQILRVFHCALQWPQEM